MLDLVATENPNPALLQVNTGSADASRGDTPYALARLEIESVVVADSTGAESVGVGALLAARPDPFCGLESVLAAPPGVRAPRSRWNGWATRLPQTLRNGRVRPLGLDRYGVQLRVEDESGDHDVRLPRSPNPSMTSPA